LGEPTRTDTSNWRVLPLLGVFTVPSVADIDWNSISVIS
jgi:hypothetical protein